MGVADVGLGDLDPGVAEPLGQRAGAVELDVGDDDLVDVGLVQEVGRDLGAHQPGAAEHHDPMPHRPSSEIQPH